MLIKILFTLIVIIGVGLFYRNKNSGAQKSAATSAALSTGLLAYIMVGVLVALSGGIYAYHWNQGNQIINIRVTPDNGEVVNYQARHRDVKGRKFVALSGVEVTLGDGDRVEMLPQ